MLLVVYHGEREFAADDVVATRRCNAQTSRYADDALLSDGLRCVLRVLSAVEVEAAVDVVKLDWRNLQTHSRADSDVEVAPSEVVAFLLVLEIAAVRVEGKEIAGERKLKMALISLVLHLVVRTYDVHSSRDGDARKVGRNLDGVKQTVLIFQMLLMSSRFFTSACN